MLAYCQLKGKDELMEYFKYEIAPYPLSLFITLGMRKNVKSILYDEFKATDGNTERNTTLHVVDGGFLLYRVKWTIQKCKMFSDVIKCI